MIARAAKMGLTLVVLVSAANGQPDADIVREANALLQGGDAEAALALFGDIPEDAQLSPLVAYDKACAHLALGQADEAEKLLQVATRAPDHLDIAAKAQFNLGYLAFEEGSQTAQTDPAAAIETFRRSAKAFQASYDLDPTDAQTPRNIELARLAIRELEDRLREQEEQKQEQQQQQDDLADQLNQLADEQEQLARESRDAESSEQTPEEREQRAQDIKDKQDDLDKRTQEAKDALDEMQQQQPNENTQQASERVEQAQEQQQSAGESLSDQSLEEAATEQDQAAQFLRRAAEMLQSESEEQEPQDEGAEGEPEKEQESDQQPQEGQEPQQSELEQMLQELLEKERQEREDRKRGVVAKPGTIRAVEKDW